MKKQRIAIFDPTEPDLWIISVINLTKKGPPKQLKFDGIILKFWKHTKKAVYYTVQR